jgi:hypothetical protein
LGRGTKRPAFGIVGQPVESASASGGTRQAFDPVAYGFIPREQLRTDRPDASMDSLIEASRRGDWPAIAAALAGLAADPDRHWRGVAAVADAASNDDGWLNAWLDTTPQDPHAWCVHAQAMVRLAWELRTGKPAREVKREQWIGFHRVLGQVPAACERAAALGPELAAPWIALMPAAQGLSWDNDRFREIWAEAVTRGPRSIPVHRAGLAYWLPRWQGSAELVAAFVADTLSRATPGSLLTLIRLEYLFLERVPGRDPQRSAYLHGTELGEALDTALADLAAGPADHPFGAHHRHWLAYFLTKAGRYREAVRHFRAVDGCLGARPWELHADPAGTYAATRAEAVLGEQAG